MRRAAPSPLAVDPPRSQGVRLVAAVLRCRLCGTQWQSTLNQWAEAVDTSCPECSRRRVKSREAA